MDDDIRSVVYMEEDMTIKDTKSSKRYPLRSLEGDAFLSWVEGAFATLMISDTRLFGVYPVRNGFFMKDLPYMTTDLRFCVGALWACINDPSIQITVEEKEDFERTLLYYEKYGSVLRYNHIAPCTSYYKTQGGMQSRGIDRCESSKDSCKYLVERFPRNCKIHRTKASGIMEVRLIP
jgi:hypothetical protein